MLEEFLRRNHQALSRKPVATFLVCITLAMPAAAGHGDFVLGFMKDVRALVSPVSEGCFAGRHSINGSDLSRELASGGSASLLCESPW